MAVTPDSSHPPTVHPDFATALRFWHKLGWISFGGPAGQIAIMQLELVERKRWIDQGAFLHALNFCMLLPGPEAQQLATYIGWRLHGWRGAVVAGSLFFLPSVVLLWALSWLIATAGSLPAVAAILYGIKPVVVAIILFAVWRIGKRALKGPAAIGLAVAAFAGIHFLHIDFPWIVAAAGLIGLASSRLPVPLFANLAHGGGDSVGAGAGVSVPLARTTGLVLLFLALWALPVFGIIALFGAMPFADVSRLFTTAAFVTFGGAYAVLPYVADLAVNTYHWLTPGDMVNGLALAETTPGPLIMVLQYVGFYAGWNNPGALSPLGAATLSAGLTTYVTFLPSFLFILVSAPYLERLRSSSWAGAALGAITAAVVGVILNLGAFLGEAVLVPAAGPDWPAIALCIAAFIALLRYSLDIHWLVLAGAAAGLVHQYFA